MNDEVQAAPAAPLTHGRSGQGWGLFWATHPRHALVMAVVLAAAALVDGRPLGGVVAVFAAVFVVQLIAGLTNDIADADHDYRGEVPGKPLSRGMVPLGNASYAALVLVLLAIPLSLYNGRIAALALLATVPITWASNRWLHRTVFSPVPWMLTFGLYPFFLSFGGWTGAAGDAMPSWAVVGLSAVLGLCVHLLTTLPDLVVDYKTGARNLPLRIALKTGAPRLLLITVVLTLATVAGLLAVLITTGLRG